MIDAVTNLKNQSALGASNAGKTAAELASADPKAGKELGKEQFLQLLLTQLSAQDPMNPTDSSQFVAQLSQFANLEQVMSLGKKMDSLITISGASNAANAVSLLGKDVRVTGNNIAGPTSVFFDLPPGAKSVQLDVRDETGKVIKTYDNLPTSAGLHEMKVEGIEAGKKYKVFVTAKATDNTEHNINVSITERVRGVNFNGSVPELVMESGNKMMASDVVEIRQPAQTPAAVVPPTSTEKVEPVAAPGAGS